MGAATFEGRRALVTGGGSGLGLACAALLVERGAEVTICGRSEARLAEAAARLGPGVRWAVADVTDEQAVAAAAAVAAGPEGTLHVVVANAGGTVAPGPLVLLDAAALDDDLRRNVTGSFLTIKHTAPLLARAGGGAVVAMSSIAGHRTHRLMASYATAKAALDMLVRSAADELGAHGIRVNSVRPGLVPTDASGPLAGHGPTHDDYLAQMPLGRLGTAADVAEAVCFLASPQASWITGQCLGVDGGHSLRRGPDLDALMGPLFSDALGTVLGAGAPSTGPVS